MKKFYLLFCVLVFVSRAHSQNFSLSDLVSFTGYTPAKFENTIARKGYRTAESTGSADSLAFSWRARKASEEDPQKTIFKCDKEDKATIAFQTTSEAEFSVLRNQLKEEGYHTAEGAKTVVYQKGNLTVKPVVQVVDSTKTLYQFVIERKALPKAKDFVFAEDFLQLTSHEYLASVFGEANVKGDLFYFSEKEVNRCSVLFPNTSMQVIFIWKDEENLCNPAFLLIGGQLQAQSSQAYHKQIEQNVWQSKQGIYSGMTLRELERLNKSALSIWGWDSEQPGVVSDKTTGAVDFKQLGVVLNCLDCNEDKYYSRNELLNSDDLLREGRRIYVSSIILLPQSK